jgi:hypothetical protein
MIQVCVRRKVGVVPFLAACSLFCACSGQEDFKPAPPPEVKGFVPYAGGGPQDKAKIHSGSSDSMPDPTVGR